MELDVTSTVPPGVHFRPRPGSETKALIAQLGLNIPRGASFVDAAQKLVATAASELRRMAVLRSRLENRTRKG